MTSTRRTARCGPACRVVWQGTRRHNLRAPMPIKFAASRRKGMWMGGAPPLGYDVRNRKLIVNEKEAELVRPSTARFGALMRRMTTFALLPSGLIRWRRPWSNCALTARH